MDVALRLGGERLFVWFVILLGLVASITFGWLIGDDSVTTAIVFFSIVGSLAWIALARRRWWLIIPAATGIGGYFFFGFKLYPHEVGFLAALLPLGLAVAVRMPGTIQKRETAFPVTMYFLSIYLIAHWIGSNIYNRAHDLGGVGNVSRAYFNALWVILFAIAFWRYGSTKYVRIALFISYLVTLVRMFLGLVSYFFETFAYIPVINYVLPGSTHTRAADLRASALTLGIFAACYFLFKKGFLSKAFHGAVFLCSFVALLFGAGRGSMVLLCLVPVFAAVLYRQVIPILLSVFVIGGAILALNFIPELMDNLPKAAQRSTSVLLFDKTVADSYGTGTLSSDLWHQDLRRLGFKRWTADWNSFLFGTGIRPFDFAIFDQATGKITTQDIIASAAKVGAYESAWWTVIAVTGLVGLLTYLSVFFYLLRRLVPILWKEKVVDHRHAFAFIAVFGIVNWLLLGWASGGFPGTEIMCGFIALCAFQDRGPVRAPQRVARRPSVALPNRNRVLEPAGR